MNLYLLKNLPETIGLLLPLILHLVKQTGKNKKKTIKNFGRTSVFEKVCIYQQWSKIKIPLNPLNYQKFWNICIFFEYYFLSP